MPNVILLLLPVMMYFGMIRPRQKMMKAQQELTKQIAVSEEIVTTSGIFGTIRSLTDAVASIEIAPETIIRIDRRAIARVVPKTIDTPISEAGA